MHASALYISQQLQLSHGSCNHANLRHQAVVACKFEPILIHTMAEQQCTFNSIS